jgi:hypothetical protein
MKFNVDTSWLADVKVGDFVFYVGERDRTEILKIEKIGREILHTSGRKFTKETGYERINVGHAGQILQSEEAYQQYKVLAAAWRAFQKKVSNAWEPVDGMTMEKLAELNRLISSD